MGKRKGRIQQKSSGRTRRTYQIKQENPIVVTVGFLMIFEDEMGQLEGCLVLDNKHPRKPIA